MTTTAIPDHWRERNDAIAEIRAALRRRSGKTWSVTGGRGTAWGWITISAPPARRDRYGAMTDADRAELSALLGTEVHHQGASIPDTGNHRVEYVQRARGEAVTVFGQRYWD